MGGIANIDLNVTEAKKKELECYEFNGLPNAVPCKWSSTKDIKSNVVNKRFSCWNFFYSGYIII